MIAKDVFSEIYKTHYWISEESVSGHGSDLDETITLRKELPSILKQLDVHSMLDIPCGDLNWMRHTDLGIEYYIGADVVPELIEENKKLYKTSGSNFEVLDIIHDKLPCVDLVFCRDCLVHLPLCDAVEAVRRVVESRSTYFAATTCRCKENLDIEMGNWRPLNLQLEPFNFVEPLVKIDELEGDGPVYGKSLGIWRVDSLVSGLELEFMEMMESIKL